jgi:hypothetical protein
MVARTGFLLALLFLLTGSPSHGQDRSICGNAPQLPVTTEVASSTKGELEGKAKFLSSLVGNAELGGKVEAARRELYQTNDKFFAAQNDAYLAYVFCTIIMSDKGLSTQEKLKALQEFRRPLSSTETTPKLATKDGQASIIKGQQGQQSSDAFVDVRVIAAPSYPSTLLIDIADGFPAWIIVGAKYDDDGLLRLFLNKIEGVSSDQVSLLISADGFAYYRATLTIGTSTEAKLVRSPPFSIDRITELSSDNPTGVKFDIVISNRSSADIYISKFMLLLIGSSNSGCNPNPIVTFKYDIKLRVVRDNVVGRISAPEEKDGLPVSGTLVQSYCDGYLLASYAQSVPVSKQSKVSYVMSFVGFDRTAKEIIPPKYGSRFDWLCDLDDLKQKSKQKSDDPCKARKPVDEQPIAFLGYSPKELHAKKDKGELDGPFPLNFFIKAGDGISYVAPHLSDCVIIAVTEDGLVGDRSFCPTKKRSWSRSDYAEQIGDALLAEGLSKSDSVRIVKNYAARERQ